jgi:hypothetical protein
VGLLGEVVVEVVAEVVEVRDRRRRRRSSRRRRRETSERQRWAKVQQHLVRTRSQRSFQ